MNRLIYPKILFKIIISPYHGIRQPVELAVDSRTNFEKGPI